jgi:hypothetical protein
MKIMAFSTLYSGAGGAGEIVTHSPSASVSSSLNFFKKKISTKQFIFIILSITFKKFHKSNSLNISLFYLDINFYWF